MKLPDFAMTKDSRLEVDKNLRCKGQRNIFAFGDCAAVSIDGLRLLPPTAQVAHQQAGYLANSLERELLGHSVAPFRFRAMGTLVSLGSAGATGEIPLSETTKGRMLLSSLIAKLFYVGLFHMHRVELHGWRKAMALFLADRLRHTALPPVKLH